MLNNRQIAAKAKKFKNPNHMRDIAILRYKKMSQEDKDAHIKKMNDARLAKQRTPCM